MAVQEQVPGTRYPRTCHDLHQQSDEHFCIGSMRAKQRHCRDGDTHRLHHFLQGYLMRTVNPQSFDSGSSSANEIPHRLVALIGNPHCRELAGPQ
ncbi:hypothetical protein FHT80_002593 [Rhizobium sp. BK226]|nr:hypothetical protein [Rhizobium sp. BK226]